MITGATQKFSIWSLTGAIASCRLIAVKQMNYLTCQLRGINKLDLSQGRHPRTFLSWFDHAHHDPEPGRMGRGSSLNILLDSR
jgi:hypothetical protein